jgi:hypothetical protein
MSDTPSPEAIVKAALERAANMIKIYCKERVSDCEQEDAHLLDPYAAGLRDEAEGLSQDIDDRLRQLASDPADVAAIIKNAGGTND